MALWRRSDGGIELRAELLPPARGDRRRFEKLVEQAFDRLERGEAPEEVVPDLAAGLGRPVAADELGTWWESSDADEVAAVLANPPAHVLRRLALTRDELVEVTSRWLASSPRWDEANEAWWIALFEANVPRPSASALASYPPDGRAPGDWDPTPEEIVDLALAYRPIEL